MGLLKFGAVINEAITNTLVREILCIYIFILLGEEE